MDNLSPIIFLDLARQMGFCEGAPGELPTSGSLRLGASGSGRAVVQGELLRFLSQRVQAMTYREIAYEAPMDPRHMKTNINTARMLIGMPAVVEAVAIASRHHQVSEHSVHDIRSYLLGFKPKKGEAKQAVIDKLTSLGFAPADDNEADAIAGWLYVCAKRYPQLSLQVTPLFWRKQRGWEAGLPGRAA